MDAALAALDRFQEGLENGASAGTFEKVGKSGFGQGEVFDLRFPLGLGADRLQPALSETGLRRLLAGRATGEEPSLAMQGKPGRLADGVLERLQNQRLSFVVRQEILPDIHRAQRLRPPHRLYPK